MVNKEKWMFDEVDSGRYQGINDSGIETFNDSVIKSLTREIIQNSLDAKDPEYQDAIKVTFKRHKIKVSEIPDSLGLLESLKLCVDQAIKRDDNKAMTIFQNMVSVIVSREIEVLVISDYGTTGLSEIAAKTGSFDSLVKAEGYSQKGDITSGGSFGIGKNAAFSASKVRTVFYNTLNIAGERGFQGVTILTSHKNPESDKMRLAKGFYPIDPIIGQHNFFSGLIDRSEVGTDLVICGFDSEHFVELCSSAVVNNFFMALHKEQLIVEIEDTVIDNSNFAKHIQDNYIDIDLNQKKYSKVEKSEIKKTYQFYQSLTTSVHLKPIKIGEETETIEVYVNPSSQEDLCREVVAVRKTGMCIQSFNRFTSRLKFAAVIYMDTPLLNEHLRQMENPMHDRWEPTRHPKGKTFGFKILKELRKSINEVLALYLVDKEQDEITINGLSNVFDQKSSRKILVKDQVKVREYETIAKRLRSSYDSDLTPAGYFVHKADADLMLHVLEEIYGSLTPVERKSILPLENFKLIGSTDCVTKFSFLKHGEYEFSFNSKSVEKLFIKFNVKTVSGDINFRILEIEASDDLKLTPLPNFSAILIENIKQDKDYVIKLRTSIKQKCVVEVKIREPKK